MPQLQSDILGRPSFSKRTDFTPYTFTWGQTSQGIPAKFRVIHWNRAGTSNRLPYRTPKTLSHEKWDYVGVCEWSGSYDTTGWPQDLNWGHESKYGTKRFGKRFGKDHRKPETNEPTGHPGIPVHKKKRSDKPKRRPRSSGRH